MAGGGSRGEKIPGNAAGDVVSRAPLVTLATKRVTSLVADSSERHG